MTDSIASDDRARKGPRYALRPEGAGWRIVRLADGRVRAHLYRSRSGALKALARLDGAPRRRWEACAEHPVCGCVARDVWARTLRGALRAARAELAPHFTIDGWTWRLYDDAGRLVASRRATSVRGWCRPGGAR